MREPSILLLSFRQKWNSKHKVIGIVSSNCARNSETTKIIRSHCLQNVGASAFFFLLLAFNHQSSYEIRTFYFCSSFNIDTEIIKTVSGALSDVANAFWILCTCHLGHTESWLQPGTGTTVCTLSTRCKDCNEFTGKNISLRIRQQKDCKIYHERQFQIVETQFPFRLLQFLFTTKVFRWHCSLISSTSNIIHHLVSWRLRIESM